MRRALITVVLAWCINSIAAHADLPINTFESAEYGISMSWPNSMVRVPTSGTPSASEPLLLLRSKERELPTFNVLLVPGVFDRARTQDNIVDSYRAVGLTDAKSEGSWISSQGWPIVQVAFRAGAGIEARSLVAVIPRQESHFILTFVDSKERLGEDRAVFDSIIARVNISGNDATLATGAAQSTPAFWAVIIFAALLAAAITWQMYRRRSV